MNKKIIALEKRLINTNDPDVKDFDINLFYFQLTFEIEANTFLEDYFYLEKNHIMIYRPTSSKTEKKKI